MKTYSALVMCALTVSLFSGCKQTTSAGAEVAENYPLEMLKREDKHLSVKYSAVLEGRQDVEVRPQVSGTITKVLVIEGAKVHKGQVLFVIDQVPYQSAVKQAEASVSTAQASEAIAKQTLDGKESLYKDNVISDFELRTAQNNYKQSQATLEQAEAALVNARNNLSYTEVKSPVDGVAGMTSFRIGALVSSSMTEPLITVSDNSSMYAYFSMSEKQVLSLTEKYGSLDNTLASLPEVSLILNDGTEYEHTGKVDVISGIVDKNSGTVRLRAVFPNAARRLMSGGSANVVMPYEQKSCIVIPQTATYDIQNRIFAYKVVDGKAVSTPIEVFEINDGKEYVVESGLSEGDVIISEGAGLVKAGTKVNMDTLKSSSAQTVSSDNQVSESEKTTVTE